MGMNTYICPHTQVRIVSMRFHTVGSSLYSEFKKQSHDTKYVSRVESMLYSMYVCFCARVHICVCVIICACKLRVCKNEAENKYIDPKVIHGYYTTFVKTHMGWHIYW